MSHGAQYAPDLKSDRSGQSYHHKQCVAWGGYNLQGILSSMLYLLTACKQTQSVHYAMQKLCTGQELAMQGQPGGDTEPGKAQPEGLEN